MCVSVDMAKADSPLRSRTSSFDSISSDTAPIIMRARSVRLSRTHFDVAIAVFAIFCMAGVVFGVSSLYPILYQQGLFHSSCSAVESFGQHHCSEDAQRRTKCCPSQFVMFSLISSSAFFAIDVSAAFWSALISRDQPRSNHIKRYQSRSNEISRGQKGLKTSPMPLRGEVADAWGPRLCTACATSLSCIGFVGLAAGAYLKPYFFFPSGQQLGQQLPLSAAAVPLQQSHDSMSDAITFGDRPPHRARTRSLANAQCIPLLLRQSPQARSCFSRLRAPASSTAHLSELTSCSTPQLTGPASSRPSRPSPPPPLRRPTLAPPPLSPLVASLTTSPPQYLTNSPLRLARSHLFSSLILSPLRRPPQASALVFVLLEACATRLYAAHRAADEARQLRVSRTAIAPRRDMTAVYYQVHGLVGPSLAWATLCAAVGTVLSRQLEPAQRRRDSSTLPLTSLASTSLSSASLESQGQDPPAPASAAMPPAHPPPRLLLVLLQPHNLGVVRQPPLRRERTVPRVAAPTSGRAAPPADGLPVGLSVAEQFLPADSARLVRVAPRRRVRSRFRRRLPRRLPRAQRHPPALPRV